MTAMCIAGPAGGAAGEQARETAEEQRGNSCQKGKHLKENLGGNNWGTAAGIPRELCPAGTAADTAGSTSLETAGGTAEETAFKQLERNQGKQMGNSCMNSWENSCRNCQRILPCWNCEGTAGRTSLETAERSSGAAAERIGSAAAGTTKEEPQTQLKKHLWEQWKKIAPGSVAGTAGKTALTLADRIAVGTVEKQLE